MGDVGNLNGYDNSTSKLLNVDEILNDLTLAEKISLTAGRDFWHTVPIERLQIPSIRLSDGPNGVRGTRFFNGTPSACLPCGTALGATFDVDLVRHLGHLLGDEAKAKGAHVLLGPTINIQRSPLGGRGFESYSEDPFLSGMLAGYYCKGVQDRDVVATLKHFVCNDQEHERMAYNAVVTDRALREIYLAPFQTAIRISNPGAIMTAYNKLNGIHASENKVLLREILRKEWKWSGLVMSDWFGTYSSSEAIQAGLDLEMPGPTRWRGPVLSHAFAAKKVSMEDLNDCVRNILNLINSTFKSGIPENGPETELGFAEHRRLLRKAVADSTVLLKNERDILPLNREKSILVIGPNSKITAYSGGGSASLRSYPIDTPFEAICREAIGDVKFSQGVYGHKLLPELGNVLQTDSGTKGFLLKVYNESPDSPHRNLIEQKHLNDANMFFIDYSHPELKEIWYADAEGIFVPEISGIYDFGVCVQGTARLYIDGDLLVSNVDNQLPGSSFLGSGTVEETGSVHLEAGKHYRLLARWGCAKTSKMRVEGTVDFGHGGLRLGGCLRLSKTDAIAQAASLAADAEQVIIFAGLSGEWETEGKDRTSLELPDGTDDMITAVLSANPNSVVVIQSGTPVAMPWIEKSGAVVQAWYGGTELGHGIADILFGTVNPSAKLPLTIPKRLADNPSFLNYRSDRGRTLYGEDIYVGYRWYDKVDVEPLFPFGHGLSYTSFELADLRILRPVPAILNVKTRITNTGSVAGSEVLQLYVGPPDQQTTGSGVARPVKELKGFKKVYLESGQSTEVEIDLDIVRATSFWDELCDRWCSEKGSYRIMLGASSRDSFLEGEVVVTSTTWWKGL